MNKNILFKYLDKYIHKIKLHIVFIASTYGGIFITIILIVNYLQVVGDLEVLKL